MVAADQLRFFSGCLPTLNGDSCRLPAKHYRSERRELPRKKQFRLGFILPTSDENMLVFEYK
jgi:hypothetical protein